MHRVTLRKGIMGMILPFILMLMILINVSPLPAHASEPGEGEGTALTQAFLNQKKDSVFDKYVLEGGSYYLNGDLEVTQRIEFANNATASINLNGHTLTLSGRGRIDVDSSRSLTLKNTENGGKLTSSGEDAFILNGGSLTIENVSVEGGVRVNDASQLTIGLNASITIPESKKLSIDEPATITNNGTIENNGIINNYGSFTNNGTISNNGTFANNGTFTDNGNYTGSDPVNQSAFGPGTFSRPARSVTLNPTTLNLTVGSSGDLAATLVPANTTDSVTWSSSNENVATVAADRTDGSKAAVTAVGVGDATITVTVGNKTATCTVHVTNKTYTVHFDVNGGTGTAPEDISAVYDTEFVLPSGNLSRYGFTFAGWNTSSDGKGTGFTVGAKEKNLTSQDKGTVILYAVWSTNVHNVSYQYEGDVPSGAPDLPGTAAAACGETIKLDDDPTLDGYTFSGWKATSATAEGVTVNSNNEFVMPDHDVTFTGSWTKKPDKGTSSRPSGPNRGRKNRSTSPNTASNTNTRTETKPSAETSSKPVFSDVKKDAYYSNAVSWAAANGIAMGLTKDTFGPNALCTRAQVVTFLYRLAGSPESDTANCPFTDVKTDSYFRRAVAWANQNDIVKGVSADRFDPYAACSRAEAVTFLYRMAGSPSVNRESSFTDVEKGSFYEDAVNWALNGRYTSGTGNGRFSPSKDCSRGQIVTLIYRAKDVLKK